MFWLYFRFSFLVHASRRGMPRPPGCDIDHAKDHNVLQDVSRPPVRPVQRKTAPLRPKRAIRNPLLRPRVWILDVVFGNYFGQFWSVTADRGSSGPQKLILEDMAALATSHESSGAHLGPHF